MRRHSPKPKIETTLGRSQECAVPERVVAAAGHEHPLLRALLAAGAGFSSRQTGPLPHPPNSCSQAWMIYCVKGGGWCEAGGRLQAVHKGDLLVLPPETPFACGAHASTPWTIHWACAKGMLLPEYLRELAADGRMALLRIGEDPQIIRLFNEILQSLQRGTSFANLLQASHALAYLLSCLIQRCRESSPQDSDTVQKVAEAIIYMSERLAEPLRVTALAHLASLSPAYFGELFKAQTGCSPRDYLHLLRIHRACQLLQTTTLTIKEVATRVGYQDPFHFSRQFKAFEGLSPSEYRARK
jgi:AraC family transcriptional regulator, arabinose operon regulatory protein